MAQEAMVQIGRQGGEADAGAVTTKMQEYVDRATAEKAGAPPWLWGHSAHDMHEYLQRAAEVKWDVRAAVKKWAERKGERTACTGSWTVAVSRRSLR